MSCAICQHAKIQAINAALDGKRIPVVVARQFRLNPVELSAHLAHRAAVAVVPQGIDPRNALLPQAMTARLLPPRAQEVQVTENPFAQFKQAWQQAKDDRRVQQAMVAWLNEQLQSDDMGLP